MALTSSPIDPCMSRVGVEAHRVIAAKRSAGAAVNLRVRPLLPGSGGCALVSLSFAGCAA